MSNEQPILTFQQKLALIRSGLAEKTTKAKPPKPMRKVSEKKQAADKAAKDENGDTELVRWFKRCMKYMMPTCSECGCKVETGIYKFAIMHIAHLLPKRDTMCPSVKYHPMNFITLCVDHHHYYDNVSWEEKEKMGCWPVIMERLIMVYPDLAEDEKRHFPQSVLNYMEKNLKND